MLIDDCLNIVLLWLDHRLGIDIRITVNTSLQSLQQLVFLVKRILMIQFALFRQ